MCIRFFLVINRSVVYKNVLVQHILFLRTFLLTIRIIKCLQRNLLQKWKMIGTEKVLVHQICCMRTLRRTMHSALMFSQGVFCLAAGVL